MSDRTPPLADTPSQDAQRSVSEGILRQLRQRREDAARRAEQLAQETDSALEVVPRPALLSRVNHARHGFGQVVHHLSDHRIGVMFDTAGYKVYDWELARHLFDAAPPLR